MDEKEIIGKLKDDLISYDRKQETINTYLSIAKSFLQFIKKRNKKSFDDNDAASFLAKLREENKSDNTIRYTHYTLRRLFTVNKINFSRKPPSVKESSHPFFTKEEIENIIKRVKVYCNPQEKCFFIMASIYGLRRVEVISIIPEDINKETNNIFIRTAKNGIRRNQFIPENIRKYLYEYDWTDKVSKARASVMFEEIMDECKVKNLPVHAGWHMIRRGLATALMQDKVDPVAISRFFRWRTQSTGGGSPMLSIYDRTDFAESDKEIFSKHPFLKLW